MLPSLRHSLAEVNKNLNTCSKLIIGFKTLLSKDEFMPMMTVFPELVLRFCFLYFLSCKMPLQPICFFVQRVSNEGTLSLYFRRWICLKSNMIIQILWFVSLLIWSSAKGLILHKSF